MQKKKIFFNIKCNVIFPYKKKKQGKVLICKYKEIPPSPNWPQAAMEFAAASY